MLVASWQQALTVLLIVIPGFVYQGLLSRLRGPKPGDGELGTRILRSLAASGLFALFYVIAFGSFMTATTVSSPETYRNHPVIAALVLLALIFVIPSGVAILQHAVAVKRLNRNLPWKDYFRVYDPTPTAWDYAVNRVGPGYVRVLTKDGKWIGGYAGEVSYYTSYPEAREIFVERAWELDENGDFLEEVNGTAGRWIQCSDALLVEFVRPDDQQSSSEQDPPSLSAAGTSPWLNGDVVAGALIGAAGAVAIIIAVGERFLCRCG